MPFDLRDALEDALEPTRPNPFDKGEWTRLKRQYSDDLSRVFSREMESSLQSHFPNTASGEGTGVNAASAEGIKSVDVTFTIEGLFLGMGISTKVVGLPEEGHGYTHNYKRVSEEWTLETVNLHRYMPYSIVVGMLFLPVEAMRDRVDRTSLSAAVTKFRGFQGRELVTDPVETMEKVYIGLFSRTEPSPGWVRFVGADVELGDRESPAPEQLLTFEQVKEELVGLFKSRNPKLRVKDMP